MTEVDQLKQQIQTEYDEMGKIKRQSFLLDAQISNKRMLIKQYEQQIKDIELLDCSESLREEMSKESYHYVGKADGKYEDIFANCRKCNQKLELFSGQTGVGESIIGICPICRVIIGFSNFTDW